MLEGRIRVVGQNTLEPFLRLVFLHQPQQLLLLLTTSVANDHKHPGGHHDAGGRSGHHRNSAPADRPGLLHGTSNSRALLTCVPVSVTKPWMDAGASLLLLITSYYLTLGAIDLVQVMASSMATAIAIAEEESGANAAKHKLHTTWLLIIPGGRERKEASQLNIGAPTPGYLCIENPGVLRGHLWVIF